MMDFDRLIQICMMSSEDISRWSEEFRETEIASYLPELYALTDNRPGHKDNYDHTVKVMCNVRRMSGGPLVVIAALFHDVGKAVCRRWVDGVGWTFHHHEYHSERLTKSRLDTLGANEIQIEYVTKVMSYGSGAKQVVQSSDSGVRRYARQFEGDYVMLRDAMTLAKADMTTSIRSKYERQQGMLDELDSRIREIWQRDQDERWRMSVDGNDLMEHLNISPGRLLGKIKSDLERLVKHGDLEDDRDTILAEAEMMYNLHK